MLVEGLQYFDENGFQAKGTKYVTQTEKLYFFDKIQVMPTQIVGLKLMVSGMNSMIKAMHKLRR